MAARGSVLEMALPAMPRITRLDLAHVELSERHPAAVLGRSVAVHGFLIEHPAGAILVDTGVGFDNPLIDDLYQPSRVELGGLLAQLGVERLSPRSSERRCDTTSRRADGRSPELRAEPRSRLRPSGTFRTPA